MTKQTKTWMMVGAGVVLLYLLLKPKKITTASSSEDKMKMAEETSQQNMKNYVDTKSNSFFQTISTRDPRDIKV